MQVSNSAIIIRDPWIGHILARQKTWEMRSAPTAKRGPVCLIRKGSGTIVGVARLVDSLPPLTPATYGLHQSRHRIPETMHEEVIAAGWVHPWVLAEVITLAEPVPYQHKSGAVIFVTLAPEEVAAVADQLHRQTYGASRSTGEQSPPGQGAALTPGRNQGGKVQQATALDMDRPMDVPSPPTRSSTGADSDIFVFRPENAQAYGRPLPDGRFVVLEGSTAMRNGTPLVKRDLAERDALVRSGVLVPDRDPRLYRFARDHVFGSASKAAGVVKDGNASGPQLWKCQHDGVSLRDALSSRKP